MFCSDLIEHDEQCKEQCPEAERYRLWPLCGGRMIDDENMMSLRIMNWY